MKNRLSSVKFKENFSINFFLAPLPIGRKTYSFFLFPVRLGVVLNSCYKLQLLFIVLCIFYYVFLSLLYVIVFSFKIGLFIVLSIGLSIGLLEAIFKYFNRHIITCERLLFIEKNYDL